MRVAANFRTVAGPWGGGNRFLAALDAAVTARGDSLTHDLDDNDIDIILMLDPRWRHPAVTFTPGAILRYLASSNPNAIVVHRINECDERKNTRHMNPLLKRANYCADYTIFVGSWLTHLPVWSDQPAAHRRVITNGADARVFNPAGWRAWTGHGPLKLVTHHWSGNWMKGFDIYQRLDAMLADPRWSTRIAFTYVGNLPDGFAFKHARHVTPLDGRALADELRQHHAYVTASLNEPGGNHQNEGALCGLPLLYRSSGCLPEYCAGFGVPFDQRSLEGALGELIDRYDQLAEIMPAYPHTAERMCANYLACFDELLADRDRIVRTRRLWRNPWLVLRNQLPV